MAGALVLVASLGLGGCANEAGWALTSARSCAPEAPPRICVVEVPDYGHVVSVGEVELLPGECVAAGAEARGGLVALETRDREGIERKRWLRARSGRVTIVAVEDDGRARRQGKIRRCDGTPVQASVNPEASVNEGAKARRE